jgi:hypothetical protein
MEWYCLYEGYVQKMSGLKPVAIFKITKGSLKGMPLLITINS